jgi:iron complex outermembrane receptor protein
MKNKKKSILALLSFFLFCTAAYAQQGTVRGRITDEDGESVIGAGVIIQGTTRGVATDYDGNFEISDVPYNSVIEIKYIGYQPQSIIFTGQPFLDILLEEDAQLLDEIIVIGYGAVKKSDLTGSIAAITEKDFNPGVITSPVELATGKLAGVQITSGGGRAGSGSRIRIRGGASLTATNDPLIVIDGVPLAVGDISGASDPLSTINPNDIESMSILKDASATAIYGSRASNGVVMITTKKGVKNQRTRVHLSSRNSIATIGKTVDVMNGDEFREAVRNHPLATQKEIDMLGTENTDWQKKIFRNAFTTDNNLSVSGSAGKFLPYRVSAGFMSQNGILETDNLKRTTASINLSPVLLDDHLSINLNLKGSYSDSHFGNDDAIGAALRMDPTKPVTADGFDDFNGYWTWMSGNTELPNDMATKNPLVLLHGKSDKGTVKRSIGNVQLDYKMHFLPELRANLNLGYDVSNGTGKVVIEKWSPSKYTQGQGGERSKYDQDKRNLLLEFYLNYAKSFVKSKFDVMAGYTFQDWKTKDRNFDVTDYDGGYIVSEPTHLSDIGQNTLISFYGRANYDLLSKYLLTVTLRYDGSSRFTKDNRWGLFPSVALAWRISEENFLKNVGAVSNLKLRLGYGITGQQDIDDYDHLARYSISDLTAQYQLGNSFYQGWRPAAYDGSRKWEQTATYNAGLDFGFINNRIYGALDYYYKDTKDLLNNIDIPMGSNFSNRITRNIGSMENYGIEANVNTVIIDNSNVHWEAGFNVTYNHTKLTELSLNDKAQSYVGVPTGGISGGTGNNVQIHSVNHAPNTFYLYKQLYYPDGLPVEGAYADLNGDGIISEEDKYFVHKPEPDVYMGFNTSLRYRQWTLNTSLRASIGNYMYNNAFADLGSYAHVLNPNNFLMNAVKDINNTRFYNVCLMSDYYLENASFLKMDYVTLNYDFGRIAKLFDLNVNFSVQNVFTVTKYKGIDPEIAEGIDNNFYPNPRTFILGINLNF